MKKSEMIQMKGRAGVTESLADLTASVTRDTCRDRRIEANAIVLAS